MSTFQQYLLQIIVGSFVAMWIAGIALIILSIKNGEGSQWITGGNPQLDKTRQDKNFKNAYAVLIISFICFSLGLIIFLLTD